MSISTLTELVHFGMDVQGASRLESERPHIPVGGQR